MNNSRIVKPSLAAYINFVKPLKTASEARYVQSQFAKLGKITWWHDHTTHAGYKHYGGRSMAVFTLDTSKGIEYLEKEKENLISDLRSIVGMPLLEDFEDLRTGAVEYIEPVYTFNDLSMSRNQIVEEMKRKEYKPTPRDVVVSRATLDEPFFVTSMLTTEGFMSKYVKMRAKHSIPMSITVDTID